GGFSPWGGSVTFDTTQNWYFGSSASGLASNQLDFYSVATHELGHVLGIGTAPQWKSLVSDGAFHGGGAVSVYGGAVPVNAAGDHWADGLTLNGQSASLDPSLAYGRRVTFSALDSAALNDLGWGSGSVPAASSPGASVTPTVTLVPVAGTDGTIKQYAVINGTVVATGAVYSPFPGYRGQFQTAYADFDHDGTFDVAVATTGPGLGIIAVISGADGHYIGGPVLSLGGVAVMVAADINGDGNAELITAEGTPLGIYVYNVTGGTIAPDVAFSAFGTPGRAALTTSGEVDRTGYGDVVSTDPSARTNTTTSTDAPKAPVESDTGANAPAPYTVSADPAKKGCSCPLCRGLSQLPGADAQPAARTAAWQDDLLSTIPVA
ncbi:MAG: matrixin family metalloprotease, partial [Planctomycetes bacterium]|nr:matrixin family metalloprotease [Planctomycetota bacterium]